MPANACFDATGGLRIFSKEPNETMELYLKALLLPQKAQAPLKGSIKKWGGGSGMLAGTAH